MNTHAGVCYNISLYVFTTQYYSIYPLLVFDSICNALTNYKWQDNESIFLNYDDDTDVHEMEIVAPKTSLPQVQSKTME